MSQWKSIFFLSAIIYIVGNLLFILFGTSTIQPWNDPQNKIKSSASNTVDTTSMENKHVREKEETQKDNKNTDIERDS